MPVFSDQSKERLATCHEDLQVLMREVISHMDVIVLEGHRSKARQERMVREGKSRLHWPRSKHNARPSEAVDVAPYPVDWSNLRRFDYMGGLIEGIATRLHEEGKIDHMVKWGGDWDQDDDPSDEDFYDGLHVELID